MIESLLAESGDAWIDFLANTHKAIRTEIAPERILSKTGFLLTPKSPLVLHLDSLPAQGTLPEWYLALQFQEEGSAVITINYPADPPELDYREFDGLTFPAAAYMRAGTSGLIQTKISLLRAFTAAKTPEIIISVSAPENTRQPAAVFLRRIDLFHSLPDSVKGICLNPGAEANHPAYFQYHLADQPETVFLFARDAKDNWSAPRRFP